VLKNELGGGSTAEIGVALARAEREPVVAVVRSGESRRLRERWADMQLAPALIDRASVVTVTLRRVARAEGARSRSQANGTAPDLMTPVQRRRSARRLLRR
jgi:hypothetical protein